MLYKTHELSGKKLVLAIAKVSEFPHMELLDMVPEDLTALPDDLVAPFIDEYKLSILPPGFSDTVDWVVGHEAWMGMDGWDAVRITEGSNLTEAVLRMYVLIKVGEEIEL